jgi:hypothetical protein
VVPVVTVVPEVMVPVVTMVPEVMTPVVAVAAVAMTAPVVTLGQRRCAGEMTRLRGARRGGGAGDGRQGDVTFGEGGCTRDQGAGCCNGHQASGGA